MPERSSETFVSSCYKDEYGKLVIPTGLIYVELKSDSDFSILRQTAEEHGCRIVNQNAFMPLWYTLQVTPQSDGDCVEVANMIYETGLFANAEPSFAFDACISYDPRSKDQWALYNNDYQDIDISISKAWNYSTGQGITVAVIDNGIDRNHEDLIDNISPKSYDAYSKTSPSKIYSFIDKEGNVHIDHGTHCAGIIGAVRNNNIDIAGVAPDVELISISVDLQKANSAEQIANGFNWACSNDADIISCSLSRRTPCALVKESIDNAISTGREKRGCVIVCAAGNDTTTVAFPANYRKEIIAVGNLEKNGTIRFTSNYGEELTVCAPGMEILSTITDNRVGELSGTSMACPHVAGIAALIMQINPALSTLKIKEIIAKNTKKIESMPITETKQYGTWNERYGYGLVDAYKSVINTPR